jgi:hypothetical protein
MVTIETVFLHNSFEGSSTESQPFR